MIHLCIPPISYLTAALLSSAAMMSTLFGGLFAIRYKDKLPLIMGFTAGVLLGLVCFDLLPEIIRQIATSGLDPRAVMGATAGGFLLFHSIEKIVVVHHGDDCHHHHVGTMSALALVGHSFMDGISIGLAFQVGHAVGIVVAIAVICHDFVDGINTVAVLLNTKNTTHRALLFLGLDALVPSLGLLSTFFFRLSPATLTIYLGFFTGFLLYIGASHILPEAHHEKPSIKIVLMTIIGTLCAMVISL